MLKKFVMRWHVFALFIASISTLCMEQTRVYTPQNTKFAFDFHDVVAKAHPYRVIHGLLTWDMIPEINWDLPYNTARFLYNLPWVSYQTAQLVYTKASGEQFYDLYLHNGFDRIALAVKRIANDLDAINGTIEIIKELKTKGYQVDMASDIGTSFLEDLMHQNKFKSVLDLFTYKKSVDYLHTPNAVHKPNIQYFKDYQNDYNTNHLNIIFIDDKQKNVLASEKADMIGIQFHSPEQLRNELVKYGILEKK